MVVEGWLARAAAARPGRAAVCTPRGSATYAELLAAARIGAAELRDRGAGRGAHVAIALPAGLAFAEALHACLLIGAVALPVDLRLSPPERKLLTDGAAVLVEEPLGGGRGPQERARSSRGARGRTPPATFDAGHDLNATAVVLHTSGTSAAPRPVELSYGNFLWSALGSAVALELDPRERWLCALPVAHVGGLSILLRSAIYATTAVVHERFETDRVVHALGSEEVTLVSLVATTLARLLDAGLNSPPALRCALTGGGPVPRQLADRAHAQGVPVSLTYGLTEACSQATTTPLRALREEGPGPGPPLFCTRVRIDGASPEGGEEGEILLAGPTIARASARSDGWLHTGDRGRLDERGRLLVGGRLADTIISGGENVAPAEVEAVLEAHPGVLEAAVIARPDARWGEAVTAVVVTRPGQALDREALLAHCARSLAAHKVPKRVVLRAQPLPRTDSGKLLRRQLA